MKAGLFGMQLIGQGAVGDDFVEIRPDPVIAVPIALGGAFGVFGGARFKEVGMLDPV